MTAVVNLRRDHKGGTKVNHPGLVEPPRGRHQTWSTMTATWFRSPRTVCNGIRLPLSRRGPVIESRRFGSIGTPVTNARFRRLVEPTGCVMVAEILARPTDYPGAQSHMLKPGLVVFT